MELNKLVKKLLIIVIIIILLVLAGFLVNYYYFGDKNNVPEELEIDTLFLKIALKENGTATNHIKIKDGEISDLSIKVNEIKDLIEVSKKSLDNEEKEYEIEIIFNAKNKKPGVYLGSLEISANGAKKLIPIILEIESDSVLFDVNINLYPQGKDVIPGQKLNSEIKIYDLGGIGESRINLKYSVESFDGRMIVSEMEDLVVDGKFDFSKTVDLPRNLRLADYVLFTLIKYENSTGTASTYFKVVDEDEISGDGLSEKTILYVIIMFGFFFLIFLGLFVYSLFFRDKMLKEMQKQYKGELRRQMELIECKRTKDYSLLKDPAEKREYRKEVEEIKKLRKLDLKGVKEKKVKEFKEIKKKYKGDSLKQKLTKWKKQGYDTGVLENKHKMPSVRGIKEKVGAWKKKGYDTSVLETKKDKK